MARLLITGASGFLGRNLLPLLSPSGDEEPEFEVHAISSKQITDISGVQWHQADLNDAAAVNAVMATVRPEFMIHLAWFNGESASRYEDDRNSAWIDITESLVKSFAANGGRRAVVTGSVIEYGAKNGVIAETTVPEPVTAYGRCKLEATKRVMALSDADSQLSVCVARPFFLLGPYEERARLVPTVATQLLMGEPAELSAGTQRRDYIHATDVASAILALLASDVEGPVNVGRGESVSVRELAELVAGQIGREDLLWFGARGAGGDAGEELTADISKLTEATDWRPAYDMESAAGQIVGWWREQLASAGSLPQQKN